MSKIEKKIKKKTILIKSQRNKKIVQDSVKLEKLYEPSFFFPQIVGEQKKKTTKTRTTSFFSIPKAHKL